MARNPRSKRNGAAHRRNSWLPDGTPTGGTLSDVKPNPWRPRQREPLRARPCDRLVLVTAVVDVTPNLGFVESGLAGHGAQRLEQGTGHDGCEGLVARQEGRGFGLECGRGSHGGRGHSGGGQGTRNGYRVSRSGRGEGALCVRDQPQNLLSSRLWRSKLMNKFNPGTAFKTSSPSSSSSLSSLACAAACIARGQVARGDAGTSTSMSSNTASARSRRSRLPSTQTLLLRRAMKWALPARFPLKSPLAGSPQQQRHAPYYPCDRVPPPPDVTPGKNSPGQSRRLRRTRCRSASVMIALRSRLCLFFTPIPCCLLLALSSSDLAFSSCRPSHR